MNTRVNRDLSAIAPSLSPHIISTDKLRAETNRLLQRNPDTPILIILDDDPTGTQTVHDVPVLTTWSVPILTTELQRTSHGSGFFILTNSRALHAPSARDLIRETCWNLVEAAKLVGNIRIEVASRSDSTLRGHFPLEPAVIDEVLGESDIWTLAPFFLQGGRYTVDDVHYVADDDGQLNPAAETSFARDASFGYQNSNLRDWVVEKSGGEICKDDVKSLPLDLIRQHGAPGVADKLTSLAHAKRQDKRRRVVILNAVSSEDMDITVQGILHATAQGVRFTHRTGASLVSARLAIPNKPPLSPFSLPQLSTPPIHGGLIIAGSHVPKTTSQLKHLTRSRPPETLTTITLSVLDILCTDPTTAEAAIASALAMTSESLTQNIDVLLQTSRDLVAAPSDAESLAISARVSDALVRFVKTLDVRPRYIVAKGGITSSDVATKGLGIERAMVVGQAAKGVPLWIAGGKDEEGGGKGRVKWPGLPYVVFPGNVGGEAALGDLVAGWRVER